MAYQRNPNDPFINTPADDPRPNDTIEPMQPVDAPASGTRMALYGVAVLALIGSLFYGMSSPTNNTTAQNEPQNNMATNSSAPMSGNRDAAPAVRDVTPQRPNTEQGMTTGSAPTRPATPVVPTESKTDAN